MKITVHHLELSRSHRIVWLLEELGIDYDVTRYQRDPDSQKAPPELKRVHPLGKSPVVELDGTVYAESGAIIETILDRCGADSALRPELGSDAHREFRYFLHYAEGSLMPPLFVSYLFGRLRKAPVPFFVKPIVKGIAAKVDAAYTAPELANQFSFVESILASRAFVAGAEFTAADIQMNYPLEASYRRGLLDAYGSIKGYVEKLRERPAFVRATDAVGPPAH